MNTKTTNGAAKLPKKNAKKDRVIHIETTDRTGAVCRDHQQCVIARAIKRATGAVWVDVGASRVLLQRKGHNRLERYLLDKEGQEQVRFFDTKGQFAPCHVVLKAPPKPTGDRTGKHARSGPRGKENKTLATR